jgi:hypothetical protein
MSYNNMVKSWHQTDVLCEVDAKAREGAAQKKKLRS